jgi:Protein of unknown function (DUF3300)
MKDGLIYRFAGAALAAALGVTPVGAQAPPAEAQSPLAPQSQAAPQLTFQRLEQILAPIALYPDDLLADILMAATYPLDVVKAARWLQDSQNASLKGDSLFAALKQQDWDPSVKSLAPFPGILRMMDSNLEWTERLGEAFLADPGAVMDAVQRLRRRAQSAGRLASTPQEIVRTTEEVITIEAPGPEIVYVPVCDLSVAYGVWPYPAFPPYAFPAFFGDVAAGGLGCGWVGWPIIAPMFARIDFRKHLLRIDRDRFALLNRNRAPIGGEEWRHDPSRRGNVPYRDAAVNARFGGAARRPEIPLGSRGYSAGPLPLIDRPFASTWQERGLMPRSEGAPVPPAYGVLSHGAEPRIPSLRGPSIRIPAPPLARMGGGQSVVGRIRTAPFIGVQAFPGGARGR